VILIVVLKAMGVLLLADAVTGLIHWMEDSFWSVDTPVLGKWLVAPNLDHHQNGQAFLKKSWWESSWDLLLIGFILLIIAACQHCLTWEVALFALIIINANQIHKWAHVTRDKDKPRIIRMLQKAYILQRTSHHGQHHRKPNQTHYCTVTNFLNPLLDKCRFWRGLEKMAALAFGAK
jgi:plasmanylethanolamine desaturase